jgi:hypothetical protein
MVEGKVGELMLRSGQVFRLTSDIVAAEPFENRMSAVVIPVGESLCVVNYPFQNDDGMADVLWGERPIVVFGRGLLDRAKEIRSLTASA